MAARHDFLQPSDRVFLEERTGISYNHSANRNYGLVLTSSHLYCFQKGFASEKVVREIPFHYILLHEDRPLIRVVPHNDGHADLVVTTYQSDEVFSFYGRDEEAEERCRQWKGAMKERLTMMGIQSDSMYYQNAQSYQETQGDPNHRGSFDPRSSQNQHPEREQVHAPEYPIFCPQCGYPIKTVKKKGFGLGKAAIGLYFLGPLGLLAGTIGSKQMICKCSHCHHEFKLDKYVK